MKTPKPIPAMFTVHSSHGDLAVDSLTGAVLVAASVYFKGSDDAESLRHIARFNLDEWRKTYPGEIMTGTHIDILDLGFWITDGTYTPPDEFWRDEFRAQLKAGKLHELR